MRSPPTFTSLSTDKSLPLPIITSPFNVVAPVTVNVPPTVALVPTATVPVNVALLSFAKVNTFANALGSAPLLPVLAAFAGAT